MKDAARQAGILCTLLLSGCLPVRYSNSIHAFYVRTEVTSTKCEGVLDVISQWGESKQGEVRLRNADELLMQLPGAVFLEGSYDQLPGEEHFLVKVQLIDQAGALGTAESTLSRELGARWSQVIEAANCAAP